MQAIDGAALRHEGMTERELVSWGEDVGRSIARPAFVTLSGDLGAGKSVLARAIARGAGVDAGMPSPTYNLLFRYPAPRGDVVHIDLYRLEREEEVRELGWRELGADDELVLVEWPQRAASLLPIPRWDIQLAVVDADRRAVIVQPVGAVPALPALRP